MNQQSLSSFQKLYFGDWALYRKRRSLLSNSTRLATAIRSNDFYTLTQLWESSTASDGTDASKPKSTETSSELSEGDKATPAERAIKLRTGDSGFNPDQLLPFSPFEPLFIFSDPPSLLSYASFFGSVQCMNFLLTHGAYLVPSTITNKDQFKQGAFYSPYLFAVAGGIPDSIATLECQNLDTSGAPQVAALFHQNHLLRFFLKSRHFTIDQKFQAEGTVLHAACRVNNIEAVIFCLEQGAKISCRDKFGMTPLHIASLCGSIEAIKLLLNQFSAQPEAKDSLGETALILAIKSGHKNVVKLLLKHPSAPQVVNIKAGDGKTALHYAAISNDPELFNILLQKGAVINEKDDDGYSPLHIAAEAGHIDIVRILHHDSRLEALARTKYRKTALSLAEAANQMKVVAYLKKKQKTTSCEDDSG